MYEQTVIYYEYEGDYRDSVRLSLEHPLPRTEADLTRQAANDRHARQDLIRGFASLPGPHFPLGRYYVRRRLRDLSAQQVQHLQAYHAHLNEEDCLHHVGLIHLGLLDGAGRLRATDRASFLAQTPTRGQLEATRACGRDLKTFFRSRPDFTLALTSAGDVAYCSHIPIRDAHTDLKGDEFEFGPPLTRRQLRKWNKIKDRNLTECPGLIEHLEATHNRSFPPRAIVVTWVKDQLQPYPQAA